MRRQIDRITHWTESYYGIVLACGHKQTVTGRQLKDQQLFIGKMITCQECGPAQLEGSPH